ncbi:MAG: hypothetical protein ACK55Z_29285, partial [bacterium]
MREYITRRAPLMKRMGVPGQGFSLSSNRGNVRLLTVKTAAVGQRESAVTELSEFSKILSQEPRRIPAPVWSRYPSLFSGRLSSSPLYFLFCVSGLVLRSVAELGSASSA